MTRQVANFSILLLSFIFGGQQSYAEGLFPYIADGCMQPLSHAAPLFDEACLPEASNERVSNLTVPSRVLNWGSGGKAGLPWRFREERCNDFFSNLQAHIAEALPEIRQSPHDLFHAHLISYGPGNKRIAAVFHAKEYPRDLERIKNHYQVREETFFSTEASFETRNFVYIGDGAEVPAGIYQVNDKGACHMLFLEHSLNTLGEEKVRAMLNGMNLGDVNIFQTKDVARIKYNNYSTIIGTEEQHSGKSYEERMRINQELEQWTLGLSSEKVIYFLTGFQG